ncbi:MAG: hypothetical protein M5U08_15250 [Burkholderiales bacterium]|nr:hypothetical protein [Burkholderiales bacterium]
MTLKGARVEDRRLITGTGRFTADWHLPRQAYAHIVRADRAHAEIAALDVAAAAAARGVLAVLTHADIAAAGFATLPGGVSFEGAAARRCASPSGRRSRASGSTSSASRWRR